MEITNINETVKAIETYFKNKVLSGEFKFIECKEHTCEILVDDTYIFHFWIANEPKYYFDFYDSRFSICVVNPKFATQKDKLKAYSKLKPFIEEYRKTTLKQQKQKELEALKSEIEKL